MQKLDTNIYPVKTRLVKSWLKQMNINYIKEK
jgi:hypothetical protein